MNKRVSLSKAKELFQSDDLLALGEMANSIRQKFHSDGVVSYIVDRNINYTNICTSGCLFCAFYKKSGEEGEYLLDYDDIASKITETQELGGIQILMQGGLHPTWKIKNYEELLKNIKKDFDIHLHAFSPPEICHIAKLSKLTIKETIERLKSAGLDSIPGGGAEILVDSVRNKLSPNKCSADEWIFVMRTAHNLGLKTTATMMFGHVETLDDRLEHLSKIRALQDETGGFTAFIPWPFQEPNTELEKQGIRKKIGSVDYLKTLAISRVMLDNIANIQASWVTQGSKVAQMSLFFGANDMGSTMLEENVVKAAGVSFRLNEKEIRKLVSDAGFTPRRRRQDYTLLEEPVKV